MEALICPAGNTLGVLQSHAYMEVSSRAMQEAEAEEAQEQ